MYILYEKELYYLYIDLAATNKNILLLLKLQAYILFIIILLLYIIYSNVIHTNQTHRMNLR